MARTTEDDWLTAGLEILREEGEGALTIDRVCRRLQRTKGAFYHRYPELADYYDALLARWEHDLTARPIALAEAEPAREQRHRRLGEAVRGLDHALDAAVRAWAMRDDRARVVLERVDARRIEYLADLWAESTGRRAGTLGLARLEYAAFIGGMQLFPDPTTRAARALHVDLQRALEWLASQEKP